MSAGYMVEKCEEGSQTWEKVPGVEYGTCTVRDLEPGKKYKFRVKAQNMYGSGEPVETGRAVLAKNPFGKLNIFYLSGLFLLARYSGSVI